MSETSYILSLNEDAAIASQSQAKRYGEKSEQQKFLERLVQERYETDAALAIVDVPSGTGHVSYHLSRVFPQANFTLIDLNRLFLEEGKRRLGEGPPRFNLLTGDINALPDSYSTSYDIVICWQTLSWLEDYKRPLQELLKLLRPGGRLYASTLLNLKHDVDVLSRVIDYTRPSSTSNMFYHYNTYSSTQFEKFLKPKVSDVQLHPFEIGIDLDEVPSGIGTYTDTLQDGRRLQISAGMLLNWVVVEAVK